MRSTASFIWIRSHATEKCRCSKPTSCVVSCNNSHYPHTVWNAQTSILSRSVSARCDLLNLKPISYLSYALGPKIPRQPVLLTMEEVEAVFIMVTRLQTNSSCCCSADYTERYSMFVAVRPQPAACSVQDSLQLVTQRARGRAWFGRTRSDAVQEHRAQRRRDALHVRACGDRRAAQRPPPRKLLPLCVARHLAYSGLLKKFTLCFVLLFQTRTTWCRLTCWKLF